jgi:hypothetical protein
MNSPDSDGVAREMHQSAVEELTDGMGRRAVDQVSDFEDRVEAGEDYKIRVTATHAVLVSYHALKGVAFSVDSRSNC